MKKFYLPFIIFIYRPACAHSSFGSLLLNVFCKLVNKTCWTKAIKIQITQIYITCVLTIKQAKYKKNVIEWCRPSHFETVIFKGFFSFINCTFVTRTWENKSSPIALVTRKQNSKSLTIELVTRNKFKYSSTSS